MGQYHYVVNIDKREWLHPHHLGDGLKLTEFGLSGMGTMAALAVLLAMDNGRGGGDLRVNDADPVAKAFIGRWAGDRIAIAGDYGDHYGDPKDLVDPNANLHHVADATFRDVSAEALYCLLLDGYVRGEKKKGLKEYGFGSRDTLADLITLAETLPEDRPTLLTRMKTDEGRNVLSQLLKGKEPETCSSDTPTDPSSSPRTRRTPSPRKAGTSTRSRRKAGGSAN